MKVIMEFDLPEEQAEYDYARLGKSSHLVLWKMWEAMSEVAFGNRELSYESRLTPNPWLHELINLMDEYEVPLEIGHE